MRSRETDMTKVTQLTGSKPICLEERCLEIRRHELNSVSLPEREVPAIPSHPASCFCLCSLLLTAMPSAPSYYSNLKLDVTSSKKPPLTTTPNGGCHYVWYILYTDKVQSTCTHGLA